jgi:Arc/MetJ-type ribon-helix-helix transcriptional regulator
MDVRLTADQEAFIRQAIETGRLRHEEDAVQEVMLLWEERERRQLAVEQNLR